jgi:gas vesicle protein
LIVGILFAPRSGAETRAQVIDWASEAVKNVLAGGSKNA